MTTNKYILFTVAALTALATLSVSCSESHDTSTAEENEKVEGEYPITIGAGYEWGDADEATRLMLDNSSGLFYWTSGDVVGLTITPNNSLSPIAHNVDMRGDHTGTILQTTFSGRLTAAQYAMLLPDGLYDYYTYFPYKSNIGTFPNVSFTIPGTINASPNIFNPLLAPMVAKPQTGPPQVFFSGSNITYDELDFHFRYDHIMSYAAIELDVALLPDPITSIVITNKNGTTLSGELTFNMTYTGTAPSYTWVTGNPTITIEIAGGGFIPGPGKILYIPMPVHDMSAETLTFEFRTASPINNYISRDILGTNFERGKIHSLSIALPAQYKANTAYTITRDGYYSIEAWGGDGGRGGRGEQGTVTSQSTGGIAQKAAGCYYLTAGTNINIYIGSAGISLPTGTTGTGTGAAGGSNGYSSGQGGQGGDGYSYTSLFVNYSGAGGGGGAGTFILAGGDVLHVSGGGAGGGGGAGNSTGSFSDGGNGGNGNGGNGDPGTNSGGAGGTTSTSNFNGSNGGNGGNNTGLAKGGGGGGGGGGYYGGNGGSGGQAGIGAAARGGGGGKGGGNLSSITNPNGYTLPQNPRANGIDGYVVVTLLR